MSDIPMIERVAKAMHEKALSDGWDGPPWEDYTQERREQALGLARAAIEAMREPSEKVWYTGIEARDANEDGSVLIIWEAMISAAFQEGQK